MSTKEMPNQNGTSGTRSRGRPKGLTRREGVSPGTPPVEYRIWLAALLKSPRHQMAFKRVLEDENHVGFIAATKHAAAYAHGLPIQSVEVKDTTPAPPLAAVAERVLGALPALLHVLAPDQAARARVVAAIAAAESAEPEDADYEVVDP